MTKLIKLWVCSDCDAEFGSKVMGIKHLKNHKVEGVQDEPHREV